MRSRATICRVRRCSVASAMIAIALATTLGSSPALSADALLYCRAQLILSCGRTCTAEDNQPADVSVDFSAKSGDYCRGEQCDEGKLEFVEKSGQWDTAPNRIFTLTGANFVVSGAVNTDTKAFFATSDLGMLFGNCEPRE